MWLFNMCAVRKNMVGTWRADWSDSEGRGVDDNAERGRKRQGREDRGFDRRSNVKGAGRGARGAK